MTEKPMARSFQKPLARREWFLYLQAAIFGVLIFALTYSYTHWLNIPSELNKSAADTSIILIGCSMLLTSVCYFWRSLNWMINYRKYLGLVGFAFGIAHVLLSWNAFLSLFQVAVWQKGTMWPIFVGALALAIFTMMALISNSFSSKRLGVKTWKDLLRTGYIALVLIWVHVILLKSARWMTWYTGGMKTLPATSILVTLFITIVLISRIALWWSLRRVKQAALR